MESLIDIAIARECYLCFTGLFFLRKNRMLYTKLISIASMIYNKQAAGKQSNATEAETPLSISDKGRCEWNANLK